MNVSQPALSGYSLTGADAQALSGASVTSNHAISDVRDSDATLTVSSLARIFYTTGAAGENNHGLYFGFSKPATGGVVITNTFTPPSEATLRIVKQIMGGANKRHVHGGCEWP